MPTWTAPRCTLTISAPMTPSVIHWRRLNAAVGAVLERSVAARVQPARKQSEAAEERVAAERHERVRGEVVEVGLHLEARHLVPRHDAVDDDAGRRERRERAGVGAVADHDGHQEQRDAGCARPWPSRSARERGRRDVAGPHRRQRRAQQEEHDRNRRRGCRGTTARRDA